MNLIHHSLRVQCLGSGLPGAEILKLSVLSAILHCTFLNEDFRVEVFRDLGSVYPEVVNYFESFSVAFTSLSPIDICVGSQLVSTIDSLRVFAGQDLNLENFVSVPHIDTFDVWTDPLLIGGKDVIKISLA